MRVKSILSISLCLVTILTMTACKQSNFQKQSDSQLDGIKEVEAIVVKQEKEAEVSEFSGTLQAVDETTASFEIPGRIKAINVEEGSKVNLGDNLAELDAESYSLQVNISKATLEKANANYQKNLVDFNRYDELYKSGGISLSQLETIKTQLTASEKDLESAQTAYTIAALSLSKSNLKSPISGTVISKLVSEGQMTNAGSPLFKIVNIDRLKVVLQVPDYEISSWKDGDKIPVSLYGTTKEGTVSKILPSVSQGTGTIGVELMIDNTQKDWFAGQVVTCTLKTEGKDAILVPIEAVISDGTTNSYVFVVDGDKVVKTSVTPGKIQADRLEICSGLKPGDKVVTKGTERLFDKDKIKLVEGVKF